MRFAFALLTCFFLSVLLHAQNLSCSGCPARFNPSHHRNSVCLSEKDLITHIATRKPIEPPGLREPHMNSHGTVVACLCFSRQGAVTDIRILSGPAMMQQSTLESLKDWTFYPVKQGGKLNGGCGTLRIHIDMNDSHVSTTIEEPERHE
jgi:hypothetical protein